MTLPEITRSTAPITNPGLVQAMDAMRQERDQRTQSAFIDQLKGARLLCPANVKNEQVAVADKDTGSVSLTERPRIEIILFPDQEGKHYMHLFTDAGEYAKWSAAAEHQRAGFTFSELIQFLEQREEGSIDGIVINPYTQNIMIPIESVKRIAALENGAADGQIQIGIPSGITRSNAPITNPALVQAMEAMKKKRDPSTEVTFINQLKGARFICPANVKKDPNNENAKDHIEFILFNNSDGKRFMPLFTDDNELQKWSDAKGHQVAALTFMDVIRMVNDKKLGEFAGIILNPFSQNIMVPTESLQRMATTEAITPGTKIQIGTLKEEPTELLDALRESFADKPDVQAAYLRIMKREDKPAPNFLLVLDVDVLALGDEGLRSLFDGIANDAKPHLRGVELAIVPASNSFGTAALKDAEPFYTA